MTNEERTEAVARAIYAEAQKDEYVGWDREWPNVTLDGSFDLSAFAQAAILATLQSLLEPSDEMLFQATCVGDGDFIPSVESDHAAKVTWRAMIRQAIKEAQT